MNLSYAPRVWHAKDAKTGLKQLADRSYDLVIVMMRIADMDPITFGERVKKTYPDKPVILLAFDESEISMLPQKRLAKTIDRVYIWSGNANVFPAIIKNIEDKMNIERDYIIAGFRWNRLLKGTDCGFGGSDCASPPPYYHLPRLIAFISTGYFLGLALNERGDSGNHGVGYAKGVFLGIVLGVLMFIFFSGAGWASG